MIGGFATAIYEVTTMESKVTLYDANGNEIGETYSRRARQLVKQQRAIWADDTHTAIQFMPDQVEDWEMEPKSAPTPTPVAYEAPPTPKDSLLYAMAEKRISDRRWLILYTLALIPGYMFIAIFFGILTGWRNSSEIGIVIGFFWGVWTVCYFYRLRDYIRANRHALSPGSWELRRRIKLEEEVTRLKRLGYTD